jgi:hypothetical protein
MNPRLADFLRYASGQGLDLTAAEAAAALAEARRRRGPDTKEGHVTGPSEQPDHRRAAGNLWRARRGWAYNEPVPFIAPFLSSGRSAHGLLRFGHHLG